MTDVKLRRLREFEWASVAQYLTYIEGVAGLVEVSSDDIYSFSVRRGVEKLHRRKQKAAGVVEENMHSLERLVGRNKDTLDVYEMDIMRTLYRQYSSTLETLNRHVVSAKKLVDIKQAGMFDREEAEDDLLF